MLLVRMVVLEITRNGDSVFYKDVSFHKNVVVRDASFINDVDVDGTLLYERRCLV